MKKYDNTTNKIKAINKLNLSVLIVFECIYIIANGFGYDYFGIERKRPFGKPQAKA